SRSPTSTSSAPTSTRARRASSGSRPCTWRRAGTSATTESTDGERVHHGGRTGDGERSRRRRERGPAHGGGRVDPSGPGRLGAVGGQPAHLPRRRRPAGGG